jgi:integral membrane protein (TIGR01906 family)
MKSTLAPWLQILCRIVLAAFTPVVLTLTNVRLLMTPLFPEIEYRLPGFPADLYGFTLENRLRGAKLATDYLVNNAGIDSLAELTFAEVGLPGESAPADSCEHAQSADCSQWAASVNLPAGSLRACTYFYNTCELKHMQDVKNVTRVALSAWLVGGVLALLVAGVLYYTWEWSALRAALLAGAGLTVVIYLGLLTYIALNFNALFVQFHEVFFESGTWTFLWSDTLIRMFPLRFWQDCFIFVGGASLLEAAGLAALSRVIK